MCVISACNVTNMIGMCGSSVYYVMLRPFSALPFVKEQNEQNNMAVSGRAMEGGGGEGEVMVG